jgi:hypothetical protein
MEELTELLEEADALVVGLVLHRFLLVHFVIHARASSASFFEAAILDVSV